MKIHIASPTKAELLQHLFELLSAVNPALSIQVNRDGLFIQIMDSSHVCLVNLTIPAAWFAEGEGTYEAAVPQTLGIQANLLAKILKMRETTQTVTFETDEAHDHLHIRFENPPDTVAAMKKPLAFEKTFLMPLMEFDTELLGIPDGVEYDVELRLPSKDYAKLISQMQGFSETVEFRFSPEEIKLSAMSQEQPSMEVRIPIELLLDYAINEGETIDVAFSLRYVNQLCQFHKISPDVNIHIGQNSPMKTTFLLGGDETVKVDFYLAPKMDDA